MVRLVGFNALYRMKQEAENQSPASASVCTLASMQKADTLSIHCKMV